MKKLINGISIYIKAFKRFVCRCKCFFEFDQTSSDSSNNTNKSKSSVTLDDLVKNFKQNKNNNDQVSAIQQFFANLSFRKSTRQSEEQEGPSKPTQKPSVS